jgi:two-component system, OmpR family, response regulator
LATSILIVDDESRLTKALSSILKASGYVVSAVENGRQALSALQASEFDLVLLDILMPEMDGLEFLKELADAKSTIKVVAMSAQPCWLRAAKELGAKAFLHKPISADHLLTVINETLT